MVTWTGKVIRTNSEATAAVAKLKGALLTLAQPIVEVIVPAFTALVNIITKIVSAIAQLVSMLFGKTISGSKEAAKNLNKEAKALEATGSAAEDAAGSLAGFDEINTIQTENKGGGGGTTIEPDFSFDTDMSEAELGKLLNMLKAIGAAILAWKLGDGMLDSLKKFVGLMLAIDGAVGLVSASMDAWNNGLNWDNLLEILGRAAELVLGLWIAFGKVGAAVGLIASGITLLAVSFHDAYENGWNLQNLLGAIAGLMAGGLGISLLTGTWIPLLIAGIASIILALAVQTGHGEEILNGVRDVLNGLRLFVVGTFSGDIKRSIDGIKLSLSGLEKVANASVNGITDSFLGLVRFLDEKTNGKIRPLLNTFALLFINKTKEVEGKISSFIAGAKENFSGMITFLSGVFTGNWQSAWDNIGNIVKGAAKMIGGPIEDTINLIDRLIDRFKVWMGWAEYSRGYTNKFGSTSGGSFGGGSSRMAIPNMPSISPQSIPRLATGGVIPPNREFMAVLGDQHRGYNIEAPEDLIRKIVREEAGGGNDEVVALLQELIAVTRAGHVIKSNDRELGRTVVNTINDMTRQAGKPVLLF